MKALLKYLKFIITFKYFLASQQSFKIGIPGTYYSEKYINGLVERETVTIECLSIVTDIFKVKIHSESLFEGVSNVIGESNLIAEWIVTFHSDYKCLVNCLESAPDIFFIPEQKKILLNGVFYQSYS